MAEEIKGEDDTGHFKGKNIEWNPDRRVFTEFDNTTDLPKICEFEEDESKGTLVQGVKMYSQQPVLLFQRLQQRQIKARTIFHDPSGPYYELGQTLIFPESYEGWFEIVPPDFGGGAFCRNIAEIANVMPRKFFTRTKLTGIRIVEAEDDQQTFKERKIMAGTVLRVHSTFSAKWKTSAQTGVHKKKKEEWTTVEVKYLKCIDIDEKEVLIPFSAKGKFSIIYEKGGNDARSVFRLKDLLSDFDLPIKVRLVYGKPPTVPCIFTGMLALKEQNSEDIIIASTIYNKRNILFEIPVKSPCAVRVAENSKTLYESDELKDARRLCEKYALSFSSMIKLSPELDTNQQTILHVPASKSTNQKSGLKTLDLISDVSLTDDEPAARFMESDTDSVSSEGQTMVLDGMLMELKEIKRHSATNC